MDWEPIQEGDAITGASLADRLLVLQDRVNDLPRTAVQLRSLTRDHLPSTIIEAISAVIDPTLDHEYDDNSEPYPGWGTVPGWRVVNTDGSLGTGDKLEATFTDAIDLTDVNHKILILANVALVKVYEDAAGVISGDFYAVFAIQCQDSAGNWRHIHRTERYMDAEFWTDASGTSYQLVLWKDVPIRTLLDSDDSSIVFSNLTNVKKVRVVISVVDCSAGYGAQLVKVFLRQGNLSAIAFRAGTL